MIMRIFIGTKSYKYSKFPTKIGGQRPPINIKINDILKRMAQTLSFSPAKMVSGLKENTEAISPDIQKPH